MHWQASLLADEEALPAVDAGFATLRRHQLDRDSWLDHAPGWVGGASRLMAELVAGAPWAPQRQVWMYDRQVPEPRLLARWEPPALPPLLGRMRALLSARYGVDFETVGANLYRDGRDSVAWHGDRVAKVLAEPLVATVSLGERRPFGVRPARGGAARTLWLGGGDLVVMGGRMQQDWRHAVPKVATTGARISLTFRHSQPALPPPRHRREGAREGQLG